MATATREHIRFDYYSINLLDLKKLRKRSGEFTNSSIDDALDFKGEYGDFIDHYKRLADGKQAIVYVHSVVYAEKVAERFNNNGYRAVVVTGQTDKKAREEYMQAFRNGEITIMVNVNLFTEGIDLTKRRCLYHVTTNGIIIIILAIRYATT